MRGDGTTFHAHLESVAIDDENGEHTACRTAVINISERKEIEEALKRTHGDLEQSVRERTAALSAANEELQRQVGERLQAEEALRKQERFLAHILASIQDGISVLDTDLTIRHVNDAMARWYGTSMPLVGKKCHLCYHGSDKPCDPCPTLRSIRSGQTEQDIVPGLPGSSAEWLELFSYPIKDDVTGEVAGVVEFVRDITNRERAEARKEQLEAQLRQAQTMEAIGQLAGGVAHDFNNILTSILANLGLVCLTQLSPDTPENTEVLRRLRAIERGAQRAAELTGQLLAFSRRQVTQPKTMNLNETLANSKELLRRLIPENIELEVVLEPGAGNVRADPGQIEQVVMNLIANARDAMAHGGKLTLETANAVLDHAYVAIHPEVQPGPHVMLAVKDTGCGMDAETAERHF